MKPRLSKSELLGHIKAASEGTRNTSENYRCASFVAYLCGRLEGGHAEIAKALADGAGIPYLYAPKADETRNV